MNVAIFGASGGTGSLLAERSLAAGFAVTALVRTPAKFAFRERVRVVEGSVFDAAAVLETISPADGPVDLVLSALGARSLKKEDVLERGVPLIVAAMQQAGVRRIIALGSAGALESSLAKQPAWRRWLVQNIVYNTFLKHAVASQIAQWKMLSTSGLDFTMVMPPMLTDSPGRGLARVRVDGEALPPHGASPAQTSPTS
jgi:putative NADH-flavin reductase